MMLDQPLSIDGRIINTLTVQVVCVSMIDIERHGYVGVTLVFGERMYFFWVRYSNIECEDRLQRTRSSSQRRGIYGRPEEVTRFLECVVRTEGCGNT